jgi:SAM-dependent methyltransferase
MDNSRSSRNVKKGPSYFSTAVNPFKEKLLQDYLLPGNVLDVGCGSGLYSYNIISHIGVNRVLQLDVLDRRDPKAHNVPFREMDVQKLDIGDDCYENIIAFDVMEHLDDDGLFLREVRRICCGRLFLSVPNADDEQPRRAALTHIHFTDKTHRREYTREGLHHILEGSGFKIIIVIPQVNRSLPYFARVLAKDTLVAKIAARFISLQCLFFEAVGLFENRCVADWLCVAE